MLPIVQAEGLTAQASPNRAEAGRTLCAARGEARTMTNRQYVNPDASRQSVCSAVTLLVLLLQPISLAAQEPTSNRSRRLTTPTQTDKRDQENVESENPFGDAPVLEQFDPEASLRSPPALPAVPELPLESDTPVLHGQPALHGQPVLHGQKAPEQDQSVLSERMGQARRMVTAPPPGSPSFDQKEDATTQADASPPPEPHRTDEDPADQQQPEVTSQEPTEPAPSPLAERSETPQATQQPLPQLFPAQEESNLAQPTKEQSSEPLAEQQPDQVDSAASKNGDSKSEEIFAQEDLQFVPLDSLGGESSAGKETPSSENTSDDQGPLPLLESAVSNPPSDPGKQNAANPDTPEIAEEDQSTGRQSSRRRSHRGEWTARQEASSADQRDDPAKAEDLSGTTGGASVKVPQLSSPAGTPKRNSSRRRRNLQREAKQEPVPLLEPEHTPSGPAPLPAREAEPELQPTPGSLSLNTDTSAQMAEMRPPRRLQPLRPDETGVQLLSPQQESQSNSPGLYLPREPGSPRPGQRDPAGRALLSEPGSASVGPSDAAETFELEPRPGYLGVDARGRFGSSGSEDAGAVEDWDLETSQRNSPPPRPLPTARLSLRMTPRLENLRDQIRQVLSVYQKRRPNTRDHSPRDVMSHIRAWGTDAELDYAQPGGRPVNAIAYLCYNNPCKKHQLLYRDRYGLQARKAEWAQQTYGQFLASLAHAGVSPNYPIKVQGKFFSVADLIQSEKQGCYPNMELTSKLMALAYYLEDSDESWVNTSGALWNLEGLIAEEVESPIVGAAAGGTERLLALSYAVQRRKVEGKPLTGQFKRAAKYLADYQKYAVSLQNRDGSLSTAWFEDREASPDPHRRLETTGRVLEWLVYSLHEDDLTDPRVVRAVQYLADLLWSGRSKRWKIEPMSHALSALELYDRRLFLPQDLKGPSFPGPSSRKAVSQKSEERSSRTNTLGRLFGKPRQTSQRPVRSRSL